MKTPPYCRCAAILGAVLSVVLLAACGDHSRQEEPATEETPPAAEPASAPAPAAAGEMCPDPPVCRGECSNYPFEPTTCNTTPHGPAKADIILGNPLQSPNMLYCDEGAYALCFFSGPPYATGKASSDNPPLPCVLSGDIAKCTCQAYTSGPYFVDINAILNFGAYNETVQACGKDGSDCANIANCGNDGSMPGCKEQKRAPVCKYVRDQNPDDPTVSLMPKADLISAFSFAMDADYQMGTTSCPSGLYAGCMTAPCFFAEGAETPPADGDPTQIQCDCPTFNGVYQIGQFNQNCNITSQGEHAATYVWSAANSVIPGGGQE
jgi:hypothetical protein